MSGPNRQTSFRRGELHFFGYKTESSKSNELVQYGAMDEKVRCYLPLLASFLFFLKGGLSPSPPTGPLVLRLHLWRPFLQGNVIGRRLISIPDPIMMHDFAISDHYAIFVDTPLVLRPE